MLDWISAILGALSLLQGMSNKDDARERATSLKKALHDLEPAYVLLDRVKSVHNELQTFSDSGFVPYLDELKTFEDTSANVSHFTSKVLKMAQRTVRTIPEDNWSHTSSDVSSVPIVIRNDVAMIHEMSPELAKAHSTFRQHLAELGQLNDAKNYGNDFQRTIRQIDDQLSRVLTDADRIMLSLVPVLGFLYHEISTAVDRL